MIFNFMFIGVFVCVCIYIDYRCYICRLYIMYTPITLHIYIYNLLFSTLHPAQPCEVWIKICSFQKFILNWRCVAAKWGTTAKKAEGHWSGKRGVHHGTVAKGSPRWWKGKSLDSSQAAGRESNPARWEERTRGHQEKYEIMRLSDTCADLGNNTDAGWQIWWNVWDSNKSLENEGYKKDEAIIHFRKNKMWKRKWNHHTVLGSAVNSISMLTVLRTTGGI